MKPTIQQKLTSLEVAPPQGSWELLATRLETAYDRSETQLAQRMETAAISPPDNIWSAIAAALPFSQEPVADEQNNTPPIVAPLPAPSKIVTMPLRRIAMAACILGLVAVGGWYLLRSGAESLPPVQTSSTPSNDQAPVQPPRSAATTINIPPAIAQELPSSNRSSLPVNGLPVLNNAPNTTEENTTAGETQLQPLLPSDPSPVDPKLVQAQNITPPAATIPSRPYRDKSGKMVMDMNLLTTPGNHYVTVTSPNGEQTRISRKFLPVLTFLNTGADNGQFNTLLKQRFQQWRDQLLKQPSFVPSATNFLDIMELKEFLQDK